MCSTDPIRREAARAFQVLWILWEAGNRGKEVQQKLQSQLPQGRVVHPELPEHECRVVQEPYISKYFQNSRCLCARVPTYTSAIRKMVDNAFRWAGEKKLLRINSVHGEEEAFLVLSETFELLDETGQTTEMNGTIEVEAGCACSLLTYIVT